VNVPILRTLAYAQINMHVLAAILATLHWYPRHRLASAMALALAVNLKISPVVLALSFLWAADVRWTAMFVASLIGIGAIPAVAYGLEPYANLLHNLRNSYGRLVSPLLLLVLAWKRRAGRSSAFEETNQRVSTLATPSESRIT